MKKCSVCGKEWEDHVSFCAACGNPTVPVEAAPMPVEAAPMPAEDATVAVEHAPVAVENATVAVENAPVAVEMAPVEAEAVPAKKSFKKWLPAIIASVAAVAILLSGLLTSWFGLAAPHRRIAKALKNTLTAKSYTLTLTNEEVGEDYSYSIKSTGRVTVDEKKKSVTTYGKGTYVYESTSDDESEKNAYNYVSIIENDIQYQYQLDEDGKVDDATIQEMKDYSKNVFKERAMWDVPDWEHFLKQQGWNEHMNAGKMDALVEDVIKEYLSDRKWLKKTAGMTKQGNTYTFNPDAKDLLKDMLDVVEDSKAFTDKADEWADKLSNRLKDIKSKKTDMDIELSITIEGRYVTKISIEIEEVTDGKKYVTKTEYAYSDINKTDVSKKDVDKVKGEVNAWLEEKGIVYDHCAKCEELLKIHKDKLCYDCYYICAKCGEYGSYEKENKRYCYDCYYICDECGEYGSYEMDDGMYCYNHRYVCDKCEKRCDDVNTVGEAQWCDDCYVCSQCGNDWPRYERDGKPVCYNCQYVCEECGEACSSLRKEEDKQICSKCYWDW